MYANYSWSPDILLMCELTVWISVTTVGDSIDAAHTSLRDDTRRDCEVRLFKYSAYCRCDWLNLHWSTWKPQETAVETSGDRKTPPTLTVRGVAVNWSPNFFWSPYGIGQTIILLPCDFFMADLCNRGAIIFLPCSFFPSSFFFFSSPNLSGRRSDVCHTSTHGVALVRI